MQSPPLELVLDAAHIGARNLLRNTGEADGDTISEILRPWAQAHPLLFTAGLFGVAEGFRRHVLRPGRLGTLLAGKAHGTTE